jgi:hypothetical protein
MQVGKFLTDTLGNILQATRTGTFDTSGSSSRQGKDGRYIPTMEAFSVGLKSDPEPALQLIRETLWWIGAPQETTVGKLSLSLGTKPSVADSRFLQLAALKVARWQFQGEPGHRLDRVPFSPSQRQMIQSTLATPGAESVTESRAGWVDVKTSDGGRMSVFVKYLADAADFDSLNILIETLSPQICECVHQLMRQGEFLLLPMAFATSEEVAATLEGEWPPVTLVETPAALQQHLARGPCQWWMEHGRV